MKMKYYIGIAKPKESNTWLPFADAFGFDPQRVIAMMQNEFKRRISWTHNKYKQEHEWEFAAAEVFLVENTITQGRQWQKVEE